MLNEVLSLHHDFILNDLFQTVNWQLATKYGTDAEITALLDYADWLITPVSNPDGYEYTWTTVRPNPSFLKKTQFIFYIFLDLKGSFVA